MLNTIISFSIKNKLIVGLFIIALVGYGSYQFTKLPIDAVPDITDNQVQIITTAPSYGALDIERLVTFPIEQANSNIPGLKEMRSFSRFGLSLVTIVFNDDVDVYWARQQVTERLKNAESQIPKEIAIPTLAPVTTGLGEIYQYVIKPKIGYEKKYDLIELRTIQDWIIRRQLIGVKGVADVSSFGGKLKQYELAINPSTLKANNISINDIFKALENNNENTGGSYIEKASTVLYIRSEGLIGNINDINNIVVKNLENGTPVLIKDVAEVRIGSATRYGAITYNNEGEVAGAVVMMLKGDNSSRVIEDVKNKIAQISKTLPEGVEIVPFLDRTKMVNSAISTVSKNLMEGALIVIFVLVLFLGNFRAGFIVASVIPLAMLFAIIMMNIFGVSGNLMSLGALDFGLIVDGAVIIVEAVMHNMSHRSKIGHSLRISQSEMDEEVKHSASRMMNSALFGQIIILVVYLPIFSLEGIEGKMFKPMAQTVAFALLGAFILSVTYIPMMSAVFLNKKTTSKKNISDKMMDYLTTFHQTFLKRVLDYPKTIIASSVSLFVIAIIILSSMGGEFIPTLPEGDFAVETRVLPGSSLKTSIEACTKGASVLLEKFPEVERVVSKIGSGEIPTDPMPIDAGDMMIILKEKSAWTSASSWDELSEKMSKELKNIPGVTFGFQYPVAMRFNELMTGAKQDVVCKIYGENLDTLSKYSKILGGIVSKVSGAQDVYVEPLDGMPQLIVKYKRNAIAAYGLNIKDINKILNTSFAGQSSGLVFEDEKRFDLVVRIKEEEKKNIENVQNLLIPTPSGTQIPLNQVADIVLEESVNQIQREDAKRRIIVGFNVRNTDVQTVVKEMQKQVEEKIKFPSGYYVTYGGAFENLEAAKKRLSLAVPLSLLLIFILLYFAFGSIKHGLLIYSAIPLSAIGGILFLALRGMPFSISAGIGFIALFGVAVLNGIVLVAEFNRIKNNGESDLKKVVLEGTRIRLRPVLMTAFVASLGFLPMALSNGNGAEVQRPLATVVIGGLLLATLLTLFVLPVLYVLFEKGATKNKLTKIATIAILFLTYSNVSIAQNTIPLNAAIDTALKNNLLIKNEVLNAEYENKLKATTFDVSQTSISGEYGQINSAYYDSRFGISQQISFPTVYRKKKQLQNQKSDIGLVGVTLKENEIKAEVRKTFFKLLFLKEKQELLEQTDSIYRLFAEKSKLRLEKGESNILEQLTAENQRAQIRIQLNNINTDIETYQLKFQLLLNTRKKYLPLKENIKRELNEFIDTSIINSHPATTILQQQLIASKLNTELEKSKLLPELLLGINNQSIQGIGADNLFYSTTNRFNSIQFGIGLPLFYGAQKGKISASKTQELIAENNYQNGLNALKNEYEALIVKSKTQQQTIMYYETTGLKNAETLIETAQKQFYNGEINYLEWTMLINNGIRIKNDYIDALDALYQTTSEINYLTSKP
ncbi:MAG: CusA/CzcA family heavy metal efflux RND transporter [Bacteroidia bacterium]